MLLFITHGADLSKYFIGARTARDLTVEQAIYQFAVNRAAMKCIIIKNQNFICVVQNLTNVGGVEQQEERTARIEILALSYNGSPVDLEKLAWTDDPDSSQRSWKVAEIARNHEVHLLSCGSSH